MANNVFVSIVIAFIAILVVFLVIVVRYCYGTNLIIKRRTTEAPHTDLQVQGNIQDNSAFRAHRNSNANLPMCDPMQAYPMPAPEHRPSSAAAHTASVNGRTPQRLRESPPISTLPSFDQVKEDLPPSYDEAVSKTKAGNC